MGRICVVGAGYVGLVTGTCLADLGNDVYCLDTDSDKIELLKGGGLPIFEPGLGELVKANVAAGRLHFTTDYAAAVPGSEVVFIAVGTPSGVAGQADLQYVKSAALAIAENITGTCVVVNKSTVPIGTGDLVTYLVGENIHGSVPFAVVSNPEFLREGSAVYDFMHPDRVVLGADDRAAAEVVAELYRPLKCPILITDLRTAEMIKYASNAFLATKISFINEMAAICDQLGADVLQVAEGMGLDKRIGRSFLNAGLGWGGSCFPKDVHALINTAAIYGTNSQLLRAVVDINYDQRRNVVYKLRRALGGLRGKTVGILGLAFKPNTDDMRDAPSRDIIALLEGEGATIRAYDPVAQAVARRLMPEVEYCEDAYSVAEGCDALVLVTEWNEFKNLDLARLKRCMKTPVMIDGRNLYDWAAMQAAGFEYHGIGRGNGPSAAQSNSS